MDEKIISGYCRALDQGRIVEVEITEEGVFPDCAYPDCPHAASCTVAREIRELK